MASPDEYLLMSGIQHFCFCRRQWALIHLEQQWAENVRTAEGQLQHTRAHEESFEKRGDLLIVRGMRVVSHQLGLSGTCDVVEFRADPAGVPLQGRNGRYLAMPVEYKHGTSKDSDADRLQLCAQAMALEEMLVCPPIPQGALFYQQTRRREIVPITPDLREAALRMAGEMHHYFSRSHTPKVKPGPFCNACSLKDLCLPKLCRGADAAAYIQSHLEESL